jgi:hypothetical protein
MTAIHDADLHRPHDRQSLQRAAHELHRAGLTAQDIAAALKLTAAAVRELLGLQERLAS